MSVLYVHFYTYFKIYVKDVIVDYFSIVALKYELIFYDFEIGSGPG